MVPQSQLFHLKSVLQKKFSGMTEWQVNKSPVLEPCVFTAGKSRVQRLDTAIANTPAVSLNFWLIKLVKEQSFIFCNSKFTACVIFKEH